MQGELDLALLNLPCSKKKEMTKEVNLFSPYKRLHSSDSLMFIFMKNFMIQINHLSPFMRHEVDAKL